MANPSQLRAAQLAYDDASPDYDDARDEAIAERTDELYCERIRDDERVQDVFAEMLANDSDDFFPANLRRFFRTFADAQTNDAMAEAGLALFRDLQPTVESNIREEAQRDAEREQDKIESDAAEARDFYRHGRAA